MTKKRKTEYSLGTEENFYSPLLKLDKEEGEEWITLDGENAEGGEEVTIKEKVEPEGGGDAYDQLGIKPQLVQTGTKKTTVVNFKDVCRQLRCQPKHLLTFLSVELGAATASLDGNNKLVLRGKVQQKHVERVLRKYFKEYVECRTCLSRKTALQKEENGPCEACHSRSAVAGVKSGFHAAAVKKANMDSLDPNVTKKTKKTKKKKRVKSHTSIWIFFCVLLFIAALAGVLILYL